MIFKPLIKNNLLFHIRSQFAVYRGNDRHAGLLSKFSGKNPPEHSEWSDFFLRIWRGDEPSA